MNDKLLTDEQYLAYINTPHGVKNYNYDGSERRVECPTSDLCFLMHAKVGGFLSGIETAQQGGVFVSPASVDDISAACSRYDKLQCQIETNAWIVEAHQKQQRGETLTELETRRVRRATTAIQQSDYEDALTNMYQYFSPNNNYGNYCRELIEATCMALNLDKERVTQNTKWRDAASRTKPWEIE
jgi:hypothetical protein